MAKIRIQESEAPEMRRFYQEELDKTVKRLQHIKEVLDQLGGNDSPSIDIKIKNMGTTAPAVVPVASSPAELVTPKRKNKKRPGRKSLWETMIVNRLKEVDQPLTYEELTDEIMRFSNLPESKRLSTKQAVTNVVFRLRTRDRKLDTISSGQREKHIALATWLSRPGTLKPEYNQKLAQSKKESDTPAPVATPKAKATAKAPTPANKTTKRGPGRPPKSATASAKKAGTGKPGRKKKPGRKPATSKTKTANVTSTASKAEDTK